MLNGHPRGDSFTRIATVFVSERMGVKRMYAMKAHSSERLKIVQKRNLFSQLGATNRRKSYYQQLLE